MECFAALESIAHKINERDADMRSHIVLSMFKVAAAEANVPEPPDSGAVTRHHPNILFYTVFLTFTIHRFFSGLCSFSSYLWFALNLAATKRQWNKLCSDDEVEWLEEHFESNISNDSENRVISNIDTEVCIDRCKSFINVKLLSDIFFCNTKQICKTIWRTPVRWWPVHVLLLFIFELSFFNLTFLPSTLLL